MNSCWLSTTTIASTLQSAASKLSKTIYLHIVHDCYSISPLIMGQTHHTGANHSQLLRPSCENPTQSAFEAINGHKYDWNRYPLAPSGCKAVIYEYPDKHTLWGPCSIGPWYLGPSIDHYRCNLYYVPDTHAYRISGSAQLFPQHCQLPSLTPDQHMTDLTKELETMAVSPDITPEQRVSLVNLQK